MSKTEYIFVKGKTKWFRAAQPDPKYEKWSHVLWLDNESLEKIRELQARGLKNLLKKDEDGYYISLGRPTNRKINGRITGLAPPEVIMADGVTPLRNVNVGNGSDVTTKLEVYEHKTPGGGKAVAARWLSSRIDNLVEFDGKHDFTEGEAAAVKGLAEQPAPLF